MIASKVCRSDRFLDLSPEAQALYFQANLECDSYGLFNNYRTLLRIIGVSENALSELIDGGFLVRLEHNDEVYFVVRDWWCMNKVDRYKFTNPPEAEQTYLCTFRGSYEFHLISEAIKNGLLEVEREKDEGLVGIRLFKYPESLPDQSRSSPEWETDSNGNSNEQNKPVTNEHNELEPLKNNNAESVRDCPQCGRDAAFCDDYGVSSFDCPSCGFFAIDPVTGEIIKR